MGVNRLSPGCACCTTDCTDCTTDPLPATVTIDFGAGGWVDEYCGDYYTGSALCTSIAGEFVLDKYFDCGYEYREDSDCPVPCLTTVPAIVFFTYITATVATKANGKCVWRANVQISEPYASARCSPYIFSSAAYESAEFTSGTGTFPVTLTKTGSDYHSQGTFGPFCCKNIPVCSGTLPATITVDL